MEKSSGPCARVDACARTRLGGRLTGELCSRALGGALRARGRGEGGRSARLGFAAFASALGLGAALAEHWQLGAELGLMAPLRKIDIGIRDTRGEAVAQQSLGRVAGSLALGVTYSF